MSTTKLVPSSFQYQNTNFILVFISFHFFLSFSLPTSFNISRFDPGANNIFYEGDAALSDVGSIELISTYKYTCRVGRATYTEPLHLWDAATGTLSDFITHFSFTIDTLKVPTYGNGLVFYLATVGYQIPPNSAGGFLGLFNTTTMDASSQNKIVMVEFDSHVDDDWDPQEEHVGINNNSISSSAIASWDAGSHSGQPANVWIAYNATTKNLSVFWTYDDNPVYMGNSSLFYEIDLMEVLPEWVTIGFSAATGQYGERNIINSWEFSSNFDPKSGGKKHLRKTFSIVVFVGCFLFLMAGVYVGWLVLKNNRTKKVAQANRGNRRNSGTSINRDIERGALPKKISYQELVTATNDFANDRRLGQGGSGDVYRGTLSDLGRQVAVKRIFAESEHAERIFINEVKIISRLIHRNLVQFIGWCHEQGEFLLVYDYMQNGSLDTHLFGNRRTLPWDVRYQIALGLASALHYLHEEAEQCVLHRDVKSANVLLDTDFSTKLGDFGVAKLVDPRLRTQPTGVVGTFGYVAPEYINEGRASKESDMFSFGIVALEIACGRRPAFWDGDVPVLLVTWVWELYLAGNILDAADKRLTMFEVNVDEMERLMIVGLWCTHPNDRERPKTGQVIQVLKAESPSPELPHNMHDRVFHPPAPDPFPLLQVDNSVPPSITSSLNYEGR